MPIWETKGESAQKKMLKMYRATDTMETSEFIVSDSKPPRATDSRPALLLGSFALQRPDETERTGECLEIGIEEQSLVGLSLKMPSRIIVQDLAPRRVIIVELKSSFVNDLSEWNRYGVSFRQDIPVQNQTISAC